MPGGFDAAMDLPNISRRDSNNFIVVGRKMELSKDIREIGFSPILSLCGCFTNLIFYEIMNNSISEVILKLGLDPTKKTSSAWIQKVFYVVSPSLNHRTFLTNKAVCDNLHLVLMNSYSFQYSF